MAQKAYSHSDIKWQVCMQIPVSEFHQGLVSVMKHLSNTVLDIKKKELTTPILAHGMYFI